MISGRPEVSLVSNKIQKLRNIMKFEYPYGQRWERVEISEIREKYEKLNPGEETKDRYSVAGRIMAIRAHGKISFVDLVDRSGRIQLVFREDVLEEKYEYFLENYERGDIIGAVGRVFKTKKGELSLLVENFRMLAKVLRELPKEWFGIRDPEMRYRRRYLDFIFNEKSRRAIYLRRNIKKYMREFLDESGFIEVETPELQPIYGGASARPFETYYYALERKVYLRIAPELYLKRLIVAGFEKVYEFARCFRNEGIDQKHNPEFTQMEMYAAYWDYEILMKFVEKMYKYIVENTLGHTQVEYEGKVFDFSKFDYWEIPRKIKEFTGIDINQYDFEGLKEEAERIGVEVEDCSAWGEVVEAIREQILEKEVERPTFMYLYPRETTPLAKIWDRDPRYVERFEVFVPGLEIGNGYSELNNPIQQFKRFEEQERLREELVKIGKLSEHHPMDRDYVIALEYGMPPTAGFGTGIDRLIMVIGNYESIRDVIAFPMLREIPQEKTICDIFPEIKELFP